MPEQSNDPKAPSQKCSNWTEISKCLEEFPFPGVAANTEGDVTRTSWVFRGLPDSCFQLEPTIERQARDKSMPWPALEKLVSLEFKTRARIHLSPANVPDPKDEFTWLAQMQHYGIPTRLLDFTFSPFVALYFAVREQFNVEKRSHVRLWAIDATAVNRRFESVVLQANMEARKRESKPIVKVVNLHSDDYSTMGDIVISQTQALIAKSLLARGTRRAEFDRRGCVAVAPPPVSNPRLASQQGVFLVNCAENLRFGESLKRMMAKHQAGWCKRFDIAVEAVLEIEQRLFQMNIHEQSLFPDMEGLAGSIRQMTRLHWK